MCGKRQEIEEVLRSYTIDTLSYIHTVKGFCKGFSEWIPRREREITTMKNIKERADKINMSISHVQKSEKKGQAFKEYIKSKFSLHKADSRREELEQELAAVLKDTLGGLEKLDYFLDAVEKLAVTSLHVFTENQVLHLPEEISFDYVQVVIRAARLICPLLLEFKRDANVFFLPKLQNVEVLVYQLDRYVQTTKEMCDKLEKSDFSLKMTSVEETSVDLDVDLFEEDFERMLDHLNLLDQIRMDQNFRMVFLFQEEPCEGFINEFIERQPRMLQFLKELEETAVQLDRMNKGAKISSVAGSSVGAVGGVLSIVGLALIPVTAGVSLALTLTGVGLGVTSGVNSLVTTSTEVGVNTTQQKKASKLFQSFMEDVQILQDCLEEVIRQTVTTIEPSEVDVALGVGKVLCQAGAVGKTIDSLVDAASAVKVLKTEEIISSAGKVAVQEGKALRNAPRLASEIPDIGQAAVKGPLALSRSARAGFIAANALFLGMDIFFICKDSVNLTKGTETDMSKFIRARAALWSSQMESWEKISSSLKEGLQTSEKKKAFLETPFYLGTEIKKERKPEMEVPPHEEDIEMEKTKAMCLIQ